MNESIVDIFTKSELVVKIRESALVTIERSLDYALDDSNEVSKEMGGYGISVIVEAATDMLLSIGAIALEDTKEFKRELKDESRARSIEKFGY